MRTTTTLLVAALATLPGCACDTVPPDAVQDCQVGAVLPEAVQTDILFVIDDSLSMDAEQANLRDNLGAFIDALVASPVANDFRIGVTTTAVEGFGATATTGQSHPVNGSDPASGVPYPDGALVAIAQDGAGNGLIGDFVYDLAAYPASRGWGGARILDRGDGSPTTLAALARDFKANVLVGTFGSGKEQPFRAARLALSERLLDANAGFLRPGARLAVFFVTDEDDCSDSVDPRVSSNTLCHDVTVKDAVPPFLDPVDDLAAFLLGPIDGELRDVVVGAIAGFDPTTLAPSCGEPQCDGINTTCGTAFDKGDRFSALAQTMGGTRMKLGSICDSSFATTLQAFAETLTPASLPLSGAPADWRMLVVTLTRAGGAQVGCTVAQEGTAGAGAADAVYSPPRFGRSAQLTFQNACQLALGDRIGVQLVCAN
jgi:hypothetical protein